MKRTVLFKRALSWAVLVPAVLLMLSGCRLSYVLHAAAGQFRLIHGSVPVEQALKEDALTPSQKEQLSLVAVIKAFGETELGLKETTNYETVYLRSNQSPIYVVSAAPKDQLKLITWWFPVVGSMPYLGFFDLERAEAEKNKLLEKGLDAIIGRAEAYSTLGWFQDPVTLNLLEDSTLALVETVLHEMTHTTLYVKGQGEFNEGLAGLVGKRGALLFMEKTYGPTHPLAREAAKSIHDETLFSSFLSSLLEELERLYNSPKSYEQKLMEREKVFEGALQQFEVLKSRLKTRRFLGFGKQPLDNAYLMAIGLYHRHFHTFEMVLERNEGSIQSMLAFLKGVAEEDGPVLEKLNKEGRLEWWNNGMMGK
jgi:predicted aminopeptidase